ncbi:MAG: UDP-3-O-(3-hydroxymyristoyl)glucosamine N-acyltransferase [Opitutales bacterium]|jgi:UDP-3-O-[3-hydroxymyristoyl] glucosamine N-acyltransferase|nr:UDP-3-O-(3-hydroxymyristoyl)glucosamine N-acyltransferase [Opitutales bacterium]MDP4658280.1 UDP-3-O-(3-hydroxymyristoyl)glucosamine N-acyltransferase [Opitutales bacterium]MDP4895198.1 UDP-3-O-(3-hydroxymyristoyl)glucosamine N-acyltransferase [Opitutales bacterium]MDP4962668.1 UDP-3-O-(3-hydroxymyristoyl)glucosamine N-acyltransferase [Opitutales bacterium]MDP5014075.1 UDP-3-O-(3-hydroxymyristoyl)glucosamine N-acyltransferase [Opitutales bacterium]
MTTSFTIAELAALTGAEAVEGACAGPVTGVAALAEATSADLSFLGNAKYADGVAVSRAGAILVPVAFAGKPAAGQAFLRVANPSYALALFCGVLEARLWPRPPAGIHATAVVAASAKVDPAAHVGPLCVIGEGAIVAAGAVLEARCHVGARASLGADCWLKPGVVVGDYCVLGARCRIQSGAVIGSDGFGYEPVNGEIRRIPQIGNVVLEDDVEVGANSTLDRARFSQTVVGRGTKIDNLVQIAHNVRIGRQCLITAQVGIAGSTTLGDHCVLGGQSGVAGHLTLGDRVKLGAQTGLFEDVPADGFMNGTPAVPFGLERRLVVLSRRLPDLFKKVDSLTASLDSARR